jgi:molybdenum cofactor synthesis domain-containing protein
VHYGQATDDVTGCDGGLPAWHAFAAASRKEPMITVAILTVSDRSSRGEREDTSGPIIRQMVTEDMGATIVREGVVPDDQPTIAATLRDWATQADVILTTGGTGFAPRDVTPEATLSVIERRAPGLEEAMRADSLRKTPHAMLSRAVAGICGRCVIVNLPGSPKAVRENLATILPALPHAVRLLKGEAAESEHAFRPPAIHPG